MPRRTAYILLLIVAVLALAGCGAPNLREVVRNVADPLYNVIYNLPPDVQAAYDFAATHPDELRKYPCYCGCGAMGHRDNLDCYVKSFDENGLPIYDRHATGCAICIEITQDVMRMRGQGQPSTAIRAYIDATYSPYGPSTDTPLPRD
ncbi:MAG: hypothetical protein IT323_05135 [Anaerolineae bacterium]|nr:hypothetical protein [Anaerolineae bacterium]